MQQKNTPEIPAKQEKTFDVSRYLWLLFPLVVIMMLGWLYFPSMKQVFHGTPTATPLPALAVQQEGFDAWCAPIEYAGTSPASQDAPAYAVKMVIKGEQAELHIPASYCVLSFQFNQPVPDGAALTLFDGANPFLKLPLKAAEGLPDVAWASVTHHYVINPPLWYVDYRLSVAGPDGKELWSQPARFARTQPGLCPDLTYPDPVTLYCNPFDPREIEPHPEDPDYPYNDMFD